MQQLKDILNGTTWPVKESLLSSSACNFHRINICTVAVGSIFSPSKMVSNRWRWFQTSEAGWVCTTFAQKATQIETFLGAFQRQKQFDQRCLKMLRSLEAVWNWVPPNLSIGGAECEGAVWSCLQTGNPSKKLLDCLHRRPLIRGFPVLRPSHIIETLKWIDLPA